MVQKATSLKNQITKIVFAAAVLFAINFAAGAQSGEALIDKLVQKGILTETEAKELRQESDIGFGKTFALKTGMSDLLSQVKFGGYIQANAEFGDVSAFEGRFSGGPNAINDRFRLRRARINVTGVFLDHFDFKLEGDFSQTDGLGKDKHGDTRSAFSASDVFLNWNQFPEANIKFGQYKAPFGIEQTTLDTILFTAERSLVTGALTPERQIGVQLWGKPLAHLWPEQKELLRYAFGVFNGNNRNITANDNGGFMYAARVELIPWAGKLFEQDSKLKIGFDGLYSRDAAGVNLSQTGNLRLQSDGSLKSFEDHNDDIRRGWAANISFNLGPFDLVAEYLEERIRPAGTSTLATSGFGTTNAFVANGYYVLGSYFLPGKKFQLVTKWESLNPGQAAHDDIQSVTGGLNYYIRGDNLKLMLNYIHTWSDFRRHNSGFGDDQFDEVLVRAQIMF